MTRRSTSDPRPPDPELPLDPWPLESPDPPWMPPDDDDDRHRRERYAAEMRPLIESLSRLRDRGLLD